MPIFLWWYAMSSLFLWIKVYRQFRKNKQIFSLLLQVICYTSGSIAMVSTQSTVLDLDEEKRKTCFTYFKSILSQQACIQRLLNVSENEIGLFELSCLPQQA